MKKCCKCEAVALHDEDELCRRCMCEDFTECSEAKTTTDKGGSGFGDLLCPIESITSTLAFATKDWSIDKNDAWIYGVVAGWDDDSLSELQGRFGWTGADIARLKQLHRACNDLRA